MINNYSFGQIEIDGKKYSHDVFIDLTGRVNLWRRRESHRITLADLKSGLIEKPEILIIGTGAYGIAKVLPEVEVYANQERIELIIEPTGQAKETYNQLKRENKGVVAFLHLTC